MAIDTLCGAISTIAVQQAWWNVDHIYESAPALKCQLRSSGAANRSVTLCPTLHRAQGSRSAT
jgi:hypothetical protein